MAWRPFFDVLILHQYTRSHLNTSTALYFYRAFKNSVHKPTDNLSNNIFQKKCMQMLLTTFNLTRSYSYLICYIIFLTTKLNFILYLRYIGNSGDECSLLNQNTCIQSLNTHFILNAYVSKSFSLGFAEVQNRTSTELSSYILHFNLQHV